MIKGKKKLIKYVEIIFLKNSANLKFLAFWKQNKTFLKEAKHVQCP